MTTVTVLMPVYNAERYVGPAIESILQQTYPDFELLVINDGSTDNSRNIVASYADKRVRLVDNESNRGLALTLNRGLQLAVGEFIARQDADDLSLPTRLERQVAFLRAHPEVALVGTQASLIDQSGRYRGLPLDRPCEDVGIRWDLLFDNSFFHSSVMFGKKLVWEEMGGYDPAYDACEDYELWSRVALTNRVSNLASRLVRYRLHPFSKRAGTKELAVTADNSRVIRRNIEALFGRERFLHQDLNLIARFRFGYDRESLGAFLDLFQGLIFQYQLAYPEARASQDFQYTVARRYAKLAYIQWQHDARLAPWVLAEAFPEFPLLRVALMWFAKLIADGFAEVASSCGRSSSLYRCNGPRERF